ncbi:MAG: phage/plasmid replication protein [Sulfuritalea sp.]|nr:phage/plasmid replication protein [Sulfuritalea sp.]
MRQDHGTQGAPVLNGGQVISVDADGSVDYVVHRRTGLEGSFDSRCDVRSDGSIVEFSGNIARFNRRDNLFGYTWPETVRRINELLNLYSIPPFSAGKLYRFADHGWTWTGARASRIDITMNRACFSQEAGEVVLKGLAGQHVGRQKGVLSTDGATVAYGEGSKYVYGKVYSKYAELMAHKRRKSGAHVDEEVIEFCRSHGVLREEFTLKSRFLTQRQLAYLGAITHDELTDIFMGRTQFRRFEQMTYDSFGDLPRRLRSTYVSWRDGLPQNVSRTTFYAHRSELLKYGIDISIPNNVHRLPVNVRVIDVAALEAPPWYRQRYG